MYRLWIDQYGQMWRAKNVKELASLLHGKYTPMYIDKGKDTFQIGYVIGKLWLTEYTAVLKKV